LIVVGGVVRFAPHVLQAFLAHAAFIPTLIPACLELLPSDFELVVDLRMFSCILICMKRAVCLRCILQAKAIVDDFEVAAVKQPVPWRWGSALWILKGVLEVHVEACESLYWSRH